MADIANPPGFWTTLFDVLVPSRADLEETPQPGSDPMATRELICDLMDTSPNGLASELDIQNMLHMLPCRY